MRLSPQQLVDCASNAAWGNFGCDGGFVDYAFGYTGVYPLMEEKNYPYKVRQQATCQFDVKYGRVQTQDHWEIPPHEKNQLKAALMKGPVAVSVDADKDVFRNYVSGIINW